MGPPLELDPTLDLLLDLVLRLLSISIPAVLSDRNNYGSEFWLWDGNPILHLMPSLSFCWSWTLQVPSPQCRAFHLRSLSLSPESLSPPRSLVYSRGSPLLPTSRSYLFPFFLLSLKNSVFFLHPIEHHVPLSPPLSPSPSKSLPPYLSPCGCFLPPKWD